MRNKTNLTSLLPTDRNDVDRAKELIALGYPELAPVLPHLFKWLGTSGSDMELVVRPFFAVLGGPARDLVCKALEDRGKPALKHCLLRYVLPSWPREVLVTLPLEQLLQEYDFHGLDIWALKLMSEKSIPTHDGLRGLDEWKKFKIARLREQLSLLSS